MDNELELHYVTRSHCHPNHRRPGHLYPRLYNLKLQTPQWNSSVFTRCNMYQYRVALEAFGISAVPEIKFDDE